MKYDLCLKIEDENEIKHSLEMAKSLGWDGAGFLFTSKRFELLKNLLRKKIENIDIALGIIIQPKNVKTLKRLAEKLRRKTELLVVVGGNKQINRASVETPYIDILLNPWNKTDNSVNHVIVRLACENNVTIGFNLNPFIYSSGRTRSMLFSNMLKTSELIRKYKTPFILTSGASCKWDLISPSDITSIGRLLGFNDPEIRKAISGFVVKENREKLSKKWIVPGVSME